MIESDLTAKNDKVYLCGPFDNHYDPYTWRKNLGDKYGWMQVINPADKATMYDDDPEEVVDWCLRNAKECGILLIRWDAQSVTVGSFMEYGVALEHENVIVCWYVGDGDPSHFIQDTADFISIDEEECIQFIREVLPHEVEDVR